MLVSAQPVVMTLFGGVASLWGPVIGAAFLVPLSKLLTRMRETILRGIQGVVYGGAVIAIILAAPDGLFWTFRDRFFTPKPLPPLPPPHPVAKPRRSPGRPTARRRADGGRRPVEIVRRPARRQRRQLLDRRGRHPRHHRPERRRQDHVVQPAERRAAGRRGHRHPRRRNRCWARRSIRSAAWASAAHSRWCAAFRACR